MNEILLVVLGCLNLPGELTQYGVYLRALLLLSDSYLKIPKLPSVPYYQPDLTALPLQYP